MVRPAARLEALGWPSSVEVFRADLRTSRELRRAFEGVDVLLHLAAVISGGEDAQFAGTVAGTERLLQVQAPHVTRMGWLDGPARRLTQRVELYAPGHLGVSPVAVTERLIRVLPSAY